VDPRADCPLATVLADRLRAARVDLAARWLERIVARVALEPNRVFPTDDLLNHVPLLIDGIAAYIEDPADDVAADMPVVGKAVELGQLRYEQGFDAHEILKEYEILGGVLFTFLIRAVDEVDQPCTRGELLQCAHRLFRAIAIIQQVTTQHFLRRLDERVHEREDRLRGFNRMVSHELKNRVGSIIGAQALLREPWLDGAQRTRFLDMVAENAEAIRVVLDNLTSLSRLEAGGQRQQRNVFLPRAVAEAVRQLRELARARGVTVTVDPNLPRVEVSAAAVELCLSNYLSNAIKYSDPGKQDRQVRVSAELRPATDDGRGGELVVRVIDNGLGVPPGAQKKLFQRFFRAHEGTITGVEGTGLGLSIVRETMEALGGRAWAEFPPAGGAVFAFAMPARRADDVQAGTAAAVAREQPARRAEPDASAQPSVAPP
jgi:signal transduction histidine kinase